MLKGAIVGYGFIAENGHAPAYLVTANGSTPMEIVAIADPCLPRLVKAALDRPNARLYEDYRTLFERERDLDFVDVTTPPSEHAAIAHAAFDRGLHVYCEKPIATRAMDARGMIEHAKRARRVLFPSHNYKHAPAVRAVRRAIDGGLVGRVHLVTLQTFRSTHALGVPEWRPDWRRERRFSGGGVAMDHGSHTFYLAFDWLGSFPTSITAKTSSLGLHDTEDDLACTVTFPNGVATAYLTWNAGIRKVIYTVHGDQGAVRVEDDDVEVSIMGTTRDGKQTWERRPEHLCSDWMDASHVNWFGSVFKKFAEAIEHREYVGRDAVEGLRSVELIEAAYESARQNSRELPLLRN